MSLRSLTPIRGVCSEGRLLGRAFAREGEAFDKPISPTGRGPRYLRKVSRGPLLFLVPSLEWQN